MGEYFIMPELTLGVYPAPITHGSGFPVDLV